MEFAWYLSGILVLVGIVWMMLSGAGGTAHYGSRRAGKRNNPYHHVPNPPCSQCGQRPAVLVCITHKVGVCVTCMFSHDDVRECYYIPDSDKRKALAATAARGQYVKV